jgi:PAS domain S-box-containing protein
MESSPAQVVVPQNRVLTDQELLELTPLERANRLGWLLKGVLEIQGLITDAEFDLDALMQRIVDVAETLTEAKGAVVELAAGDEMVYRCASKSIAHHVGLRLGRAASLSGLCVAEARALRCDDTESDGRVDKEACRRVGVRSMVCVPLLRRGSAVGVLKVMGSEAHAFDADDQYLLSLLAGSLGAALGKQLVIEALKTSEETFRSAMQTTSIGMGLVKPNGEFLKVNPALCDLLGYTEQELLSRDVQSLSHPEDRERDRSLMVQALRGEISQYRVEKRYYHKSGHIIWVLISVALVRDGAGVPSFFVGHVQDQSEQREMDRMKNELISMISHELRTPLTSIRGSLGLIMGSMDHELPQKMRALLEIAQSNAERLIRLTNDILDIDKMAAGQMRFDVREHSLAQSALKAIRANEAYVEKYKARIELEPMDSQLRVVMDEDRFLQVLANLLSNAAKFSPAGGVITLRCDVQGNRARLNVIDQGPGIPVEFRNRIFGKFTQADASSSRRVGGTGLGLHIARKIVEQMHGRIGFDTIVGQGSTFWIEFPLVSSRSGQPATAGVTPAVKA